MFFKRAQKKVLIQDMINSLKTTFLQIKSMKTAMLKGYVNDCATKIQKIFKGFYSRRVIIPIKLAFA